MVTVQYRVGCFFSTVKTNVCPVLSCKYAEHIELFSIMFYHKTRSADCPGGGKTYGGRIDESKTLHVGTAGLVALEDGFRGL